MRGSETITVKPQVKVDRLRDSTAAAPASYTIAGCIVWPRSAQEEGKGWVQIDGQNVFCPPGSVVPATARVVLRGEEYEVDGTPGDYQMHGRSKGLLVVLVRVGSAA